MKRRFYLLSHPSSLTPALTYAHVPWSGHARLVVVPFSIRKICWVRPSHTCERSELPSDVPVSYSLRRVLVGNRPSGTDHSLKLSRLLRKHAGRAEALPAQ